MKDIVVVGHGKSPAGKGWGRNIDEHTMVIRMWNCHWQNTVDYGNRYDVGFFEINSSEMQRFNTHKTRIPAVWVATELHSNIEHKKYKGDLPGGTEVVDSKPWELLGMHLGGEGTKGRLVLSRGVRAACWAIGRMQRGQTLVLVGFDNVRAGLGLSIAEGYHPAWVDCPAGFPFRDYEKNAVGNTKYGNHDYAIEEPLLRALAKRRRVKLAYAEDIW